MGEKHTQGAPGDWHKRGYLPTERNRPTPLPDWVYDVPKKLKNGKTAWFLRDCEECKINHAEKHRYGATNKEQDTATKKP